MGFLSNAVRKVVFWNYPRTSWQWDVLCVLILVFIFLTPKSWFDNSEFKGHQKVVISAELVGTQPDRAVIEQRARDYTHRPSGTVSEPRPIRDEAGRVIAYEVDIR
jgi:hypothetical protein